MGKKVLTFWGSIIVGISSRNSLYGITTRHRIKSGILAFQRFERLFTRMGYISLQFSECGRKNIGKLCAGESHAQFDEGEGGKIIFPTNLL